jgi:acetyl esterase/lipase
MRTGWKTAWLLGCLLVAGRAEEIPLWPTKAPLENGLTGPEEPNPAGFRNVSVATLRPFLVPKAEGPVAAVVVIPGGGYGSVCTLTEGTPIAEWLLKRGIAAFVLKYRLPNGHWEVPLMDARRAIRLVRARAGEWNVDPAKIGVWGFSAGGHLASFVSTAGETEGDLEGTLIDPGSARPDFSILFYPVISMEDGIGHRGSRRNLTGSDSAAEGARFSTDLRVSAGTPPAWLLHAMDDGGVSVENSVRYVLALRRHGIAAEAMLYEKGGHGPKAFQTNPSWERALEDWLSRRDLLSRERNK